MDNVDDIEIGSIASMEDAIDDDDIDSDIDIDEDDDDEY